MANLATQVGMLEFNLGILATTIGNRHTPGSLPSLPEINPKGKCHAVQLRSGTTYQPPEAGDLGRRGREIEKPPGTLSVDDVRRPAAFQHGDPPRTHQQDEEDSGIGVAEDPAVATPHRGGPPADKQQADALPQSSVTIPYPQRLKSKKLDAQFTKFLEAMSKVHINIPLVEALQQMPNYAKFLKDVVAKKRKWGKYETVGLTESCSAIIQKGLPTKHKDPGSFTLSCVLGNDVRGKALCDLGSSINLMPLSFYRKLDVDSIRPTSITLQMADRSTTTPMGIVEDVLVRVGEFIFPADFVVLDMQEDKKVPLILGRPFLATGGAMIDVQKGELTLKLNDESITFNIYGALKFHGKEGAEGYQECSVIQIVTDCVGEVEVTYHQTQDPLESCLINSFTPNVDLSSCDASVCAVVTELEALPERIPQKGNAFLPLRTPEEEEERRQAVGKPRGPPKVELKPLPEHLRYAFLGPGNIFPVVVSAALNEEECEKLLCVLNKYRSAIGWSISDLRGISPTTCMHRILLEEGHKPRVQSQRRLNPIMQDVVRKEVIKLLDAGIIYAISDSEWVSPTQVVAKKGGMTVVPGQNGEMIATRVATGWRICIDYRMLNAATRKDHFPLPFIDQMLDRLGGYDYYCFLDGYSGYNQIAIAPEDQHKSAFTCPYGIFAYRKMSFGLCNAPATFQRCMMAIFHDLIEKVMEVFMDDFSVFSKSYDHCLENLAKVLQRCVETNLVLNWEKCHFMVKEGIVLGHKVSSAGIEVDRAKIAAIEKLPPPCNEKGVRSFLGHAGFYRRFIKDFSKISKPLCKLLEKDVKFDFTSDCLQAFETLKKALVSAPILITPD